MLRFLLPHSRSLKLASYHLSQQKLILKSKVPEAAVLEKMEMTKLDFKKQVHHYSTTLTAKTIPKSFKQLMVKALNSRTKCLPNYIAFKDFGPVLQFGRFLGYLSEILGSARA